ncbi:hypothetical protein BKA62DRAFT_720279 [Auriculariales sp. MPI-PUGE-AT-0066]|nr:hypothetical protein BKA62DRAFT_720279 [Auriculariales sp. MPI-PUGE-AT-0066]
MHRASSIDIQASNPTMTIFPDAAIIPVPYVERPLRKLHLRGCPLGDMLCLVGPQCIRIELVNLHSPNLRLRDLAEALRGAPALAHLIIEHNYFQDDAPGVVDETASRPLALQYLKLDDVSPMYKLLPLVFRLFSGTALSAPMVKVERSDLDLEEWSELCPQGFLQLLQLANLGVPKVIRVLNAGSEYDISFPNGISRSCNVSSASLAP